MTIEHESHGFADQLGRATALPSGGNHPLRLASNRIAEVREGRSPFKTRDLVGLLLSHGARAWRASQPATVSRIRVRNIEGTPAVRLRIG